MGSAEEKVSLALFGLMLAGGAITVSWGQIQRHATTTKMPTMLHPPGQIYIPSSTDPSAGLKDLQANTGDESTP